jgi:ElaA protein
MQISPVHQLPQITWHSLSFNQLTIDLLYDVLALRSKVFVLEQNSAYDDVDDIDKYALHLVGLDANLRLLAYARLIPVGVKYPQYASIGRVVILPELRNLGLGKQLIEKAVFYCTQFFGAHTQLKLSSQLDKEPIYHKQGFRRTTRKPYSDGGILHVDMVMRPKTLYSPQA